MTKILNNRFFTLILLTVIVLTIAIVWTTTYYQPKQDRTAQDQTAELGISWAYAYDNVEQLSIKADLIVVGRIAKVIAETSEGIWGAGHLYFTDFSFDVDKVLKGKEVKQITIHQTGAVGKQEVSDDPLFVPGEQYILFLHEYEDGKYFVLGGPQGRFKIVGDEVFTMNRVLPDKVVLPQGLDINGMQKTDFIDSISRQVSN